RFLCVRSFFFRIFLIHLIPGSATERGPGFSFFFGGGDGGRTGEIRHPPAVPFSPSDAAPGESIRCPPCVADRCGGDAPAVWAPATPVGGPPRHGRPRAVPSISQVVSLQRLH